MTDTPKRRLFESFATVAKALGNGHRLELLELLAQGERSVEALTRLTGLTFGNTSQHLQQLRRSGLVAVRKDGKRVFYRLADDEVVALISVLRRIAERNLAEVDRVVAGYFRERDSLEPVSRDELVARMRDDGVTILDLRPPEEFAAGHVPGALNITVEELEEKLGDIPSGREVIAYCRGPYCVLSFEAVALLRQNGFEARRLEDGFPEWKHAGRPVSMRT